MTIQEIQRALRAAPFEPFRLMTADGRTYDVKHRENLAFGGRGRLIAIAMPDDSFVTLDLLLVTAIQKPIPRRQRARGPT
jgi:hypothetical protein